MPPEFCAEVLIATILLWVSVFGLCEEALRRVEKTEVRVSIYVLLGISVISFVQTQRGLSSCTLM